MNCPHVHGKHVKNPWKHFVDSRKGAKKSTVYVFVSATPGYCLGVHQRRRWMNVVCVLFPPQNIFLWKNFFVLLYKEHAWHHIMEKIVKFIDSSYCVIIFSGCGRNQTDCNWISSREIGLYHCQGNSLTTANVTFGRTIKVLLCRRATKNSFGDISMTGNEERNLIKFSFWHFPTFLADWSAFSDQKESFGLSVGSSVQSINPVCVLSSFSIFKHPLKCF